MKAIAIFLLSLLPVAIFAADTNCSMIEEPEARLKCFDEVYPNVPDHVADDVLNSIVEPIIQKGELLSPKSQLSENLKERNKAKNSVKKGFFSRSESQTKTATIVDLLKKDKQRMAFQLDNDEIWIQNSPRTLPFKKGDTVIIKSGRLGGFIMRTESGVSTRVIQMSPSSSSGGRDSWNGTVM